MRDDAEMEKKVAPDSVAIALPISVFPVPGGPKRSSPLEGWRRPVKRSGRWIGQTTASITLCFANSSPATSSQRTPGDLSSTSFRIISAILGSTPLYSHSASGSAAAPPPPLRIIPPPPYPPPPPPPRPRLEGEGSPSRTSGDTNPELTPRPRFTPSERGGPPRAEPP